MKRYAKFGLPVLLALAILLASCTSGRDQGAGEDMDHGSMDHDGTASGMVMKGGKYSDERFIDAMVPHHQGAVEMARIALKNAEHPEIEQLAENIISTQRAEIHELKSIKKEEFGTSRVPMDMSMGQMKKMGMMDPGDLAKRDPFDKAFIDNMIPHHQAAIEMAGVALKETDNPEIEDLATNIVEAQKREISQMKRWRKQWYPQG